MSANATTIAKFLSLYVNSITSSNILSDSESTLSPKQIDEIVEKLNESLIINSSKSFIIAQQLNPSENITDFGASFKRGVGGNIIKNTKVEIDDPSISIGALISNSSLVGVTSFNMLIIDEPISYKNLNDSNQTMLASSVIVVTVQGNSSLSNSMHISLYFQVLNEYIPNFNPNYSCSYYDKDTLKWSDSKCTIPTYNRNFRRYECSCNHLSTFALVWSRNITYCDTLTRVSYSNGSCIPKDVVQV